MSDTKQVLLLYGTDGDLVIHGAILTDAEFTIALEANNKYYSSEYSTDSDWIELEPFLKLLFLKDEDGYPRGIVDYEKWTRIPFGTTLNGEFTIISFDWDEY